MVVEKVFSPWWPGNRMNGGDEMGDTSLQVTPTVTHLFQTDPIS